MWFNCLNEFSGGNLKDLFIRKDSLLHITFDLPLEKHYISQLCFNLWSLHLNFPLKLPKEK